MKNPTLPLLVGVGVLLIGTGGPARAASHSDAPLIKQDPQANLTDVYAFIGSNRANKKVLNVVVQVHPFAEPGDGVIYDRFSADALYEVRITNPATGAEAMRYSFRFSDPTAVKNGDTILSYGRGTEIGPIQNIGDARQNFTQTYLVTQTVGRKTRMLGTGTCPPPNVGKRTTPFYNDADGRAVSGATTYEALDKYTHDALKSFESGETVFAGAREDSFFSDIPGIFDLLDPRILGGDGLGQSGGGVDGFKGFNVLAYAIQIPVDRLTKVPGFPKVGVYASVSRPRITLRTERKTEGKGEWVQVNRMGNPLFNEALVALKDKDNFNRTSPTGDVQTFDKYARSPEVITLINTVFGTPFVTTDRTDLVGIFIPDVLRVDTSTEPVRLAGQAGFSRLSFIGGDSTTNAQGDSVPSGWPNGRRLGDDVIDIAFTAIASGPSFTTITILGDNIAANDQVYNQVFPYAGTPNAGTRNTKDSGPNVEP